MILKAKHLYRGELKADLSLGYGKRYVLTFPLEDTHIDSRVNQTIGSFAQIDILGTYGEHSSIYFGDSFVFKEPTVSDVFEIIQEMRKRKNYRYNLRTKEIEKIK